MSQCLTCEKAKSCALEWKDQGNWVSCTAYVPPPTPDIDSLRYETMCSLCFHNGKESCKKGGPNVICCDEFTKKVKTNYDQLRAMSVEELAAWLEDRTMLPINGLWLDWLRQEAE